MISSLSGRVPAWIINYSAGLRSRLEARIFLVFTALILANLSRAVFPGGVTDLIFAVAVLVIGFMLVGEKIPNRAKPTALCFLILLGIYAAAILSASSNAGARQTFGILASGIIYLFCYIHGPRLIRSKHILPLLAGAMAIMTLRYILMLRGVQSSTVTSSIMCGILVCLTLTIGIVLILRSANRARQHRWALLMFTLVIVFGIIFSLRSVVAVALSAYPLYWMLFYALRNRLVGILLAVSSIAGIVLVIIIVATPAFDSLLGEANRFARIYLGGRITSGREELWSKAVDDIAASLWSGQGAGAVVTEASAPELSTERKETITEKGNPTLPVSRALSKLNDLHPPSRNIPKSAHNLFLQIGVQTGLVGIAVLAALCLSLFVSLRSKKGEKVRPLQRYVATYTFMLIYLSVFEVFLLQNILYWGVFAWILIGIGAAVVNDRARDQDRSAALKSRKPG